MGFIDYIIYLVIGICVLIGVAVIAMRAQWRRIERERAAEEEELQRQRQRQTDEMRQQRLEREQNLSERFGETIAARILSGELWVGQSSEQLREALGVPEDIDERVVARKRRETWKYDQVGQNRFNTKIMVEDGVVTGWDRKNR